MNTNREEIRKLIDSIPDETLSEAYKILKRLTIPTIEATPDELKIIRQAENEYKRGEYYTFNEVFGDDN